MSGIQAKAVLKYAVMPEVIPRLQRLFASGFGHIAYLMAIIYNMVRLLPDGHPYLDGRNVGKFGIRHVIATAANHLVISRKNIDQILIFGLLLVGVVLLALMIGLFLFSLIFQNAFAAGGGAAGTFASMFVTQLPANDIAFMLLDQVFGIPQFYGSCVAQNVACFPGQAAGAGFPWPFHLALQQMFKFYSSGILIIGALILLYFIVVIVIETATSGSPFGQRFKNMWVPVRLVVAVGLLIPLNYGYSAAQYITFAAAKYGSGFATNAWNLYNNTIATSGAGAATNANPTGEAENLIALPGMPDASTFLQMMSIVHGCAFGYYVEDPGIDKTAVPPPGTTGAIAAYQNANKIKAYLVKNPQSFMTDQRAFVALQGQTYDQALAFAANGDIVIRFGKALDDQGRYTTNLANAKEIEPTCGDVRVIINEHRLSTDAPAGTYLGALEVQKYFYQLVSDMWYQTARNDTIIQFAGRTYLLSHNNPNTAPANAQAMDPCQMGCNIATLPSCTAGSAPLVAANEAEVATPRTHARACMGQPVGAEWKLRETGILQTAINGALTAIWTQYNQNNAEMLMGPDLLRYGWAGAGIWYSRLAQVNGAFAGGFMDYPNLDKYPKLMEKVASLKKGRNNDPSGMEIYNPNMGDNEVSQINTTEPQGGMALALGMYAIHEYWNRGGPNNTSTEKIMSTGALENAMNLVFGTHGLFSMTTTNAHIHPLAQLVSLGKGLVEASIRNIAGSTMIAAGGGLLAALEPALGPLAPAAAGLATSTAFIGLTAGFVLFYVLPFLPFVYFYFAVATWVKTIFEAMVGVPLWALAHLRLDGEGLPGEAASNGYFLIFEIFIRPILSIVGMIASLIIFTAQVRLLHFVWMLVTENVGGTVDDTAKINVVGNLNINRSIIDEFFFTVMYAIIVYMLAIASFKLIDRIPDNLLRWMGQGVSSFSDINQDATEGLTRYAAVGGMQAGQQITQGISSAAEGTGGALASLFKQRPGV